MSDLKATRNAQEAGSGFARPRMSILQRHGLIHGCRGTEFGADKYARGNYFGPPPEGVDPVDRYLEYIDAAIRHLTHISQAINFAKGTGGDQRAACAVVDEDASSGFPPSMLPHHSHAIAGLMIAAECAVHDGLLPADPGQPWTRDPGYADAMARRGKPVRGAALSQKDDPAAEERRIAERRRAATVDESRPTLAKETP